MFLKDVFDKFIEIIFALFFLGVPFAFNLFLICHIKNTKEDITFIIKVFIGTI